MCGRFYIDKETFEQLKKKIRSKAEIINERSFDGDINPMDKAPIIVAGQDGTFLTAIKWGYPAFGKGSVIFNARSESVLEKKMFRNGILNNRAIIPATGFYEWNKLKEKNTFTDADKRCLFLAGFYDNFGNEKRFVIITTSANSSMQAVHDRMPLAIEENQIEEWINDNKQTAGILNHIPALLTRTTQYEQQSLFE